MSTENTVKITFELSQRGQKDSLLKGGNGKTEQSIYVALTPELLERANVNPDGSAYIVVGGQWHTVPTTEQLLGEDADSVKDKKKEEAAKKRLIVEKSLNIPIETFFDYRLATIIDDEALKTAIVDKMKLDTPYQYRYQLEPTDLESFAERAEAMVPEVRRGYWRYVAENCHNSDVSEAMVQAIKTRCDVPEYVETVQKRHDQLVTYARKKAAYEEYENSERSEWIALHGSDDLKTMAALGLNDYYSLYEEERAKLRLQRFVEIVREFDDQSAPVCMAKIDYDRRHFSYTVRRPTRDQLAKLKFARELDGEACFWAHKYVWIAIHTDAVDTKKDWDGKLIPHLFIWRVGDNPDYIDRREDEDQDD